MGTACQVGIEIERSIQVILCIDFNFRISLLFKHKPFQLVNPDFIIITSLMTLVNALVAEQVGGPKSGTLTIREEATDICARIDTSSKLQKTIQALVTRVNYLIAEQSLIPQSGLDGVQGDTTTMESEALTMATRALSISESLEPGNLAHSTIESFLSRPFLVRYGSIDATDVGMWFQPTDILTDYISGFPVVTNKLAGYYGMKFTACIRLLLNAEKFQQGRFILGNIPSGGYNSTTSRMASWCKHHAGFTESRLQCDHVEIDLATETECTLKIPWN